METNNDASNETQDDHSGVPKSNKSLIDEIINL